MSPARLVLMFLHFLPQSLSIPGILSKGRIFFPFFFFSERETETERIEVIDTDKMSPNGICFSNLQGNRCRFLEIVSVSEDSWDPVLITIPKDTIPDAMILNVEIPKIRCEGF